MKQNEMKMKGFEEGWVKWIMSLLICNNGYKMISSANAQFDIISITAAE